MLIIEGLEYPYVTNFTPIVIHVPFANKSKFYVILNYILLYLFISEFAIFRVLTHLVPYQWI